MPLTAKEMLKLLKANGYEVKTQHGSHIKLYRQADNKTVILPMHSKDLGKGLEQAILKQAGVTKIAEKE